MGEENRRELSMYFDQERLEEYVDYVPELLKVDPEVLRMRLTQVREKLGESWAEILELDAEGDEYLFLEHLCSEYEAVWSEALAGLKRPVDREWSFVEALRELGAEPDVQKIDELYGFDLLYLLDAWQDEVCANVAYLQSIGVEEPGEVVTRWPHIFISFEGGLAPIMEELLAERGETYVEKLNENMEFYEEIFNWEN